MMDDDDTSVDEDAWRLIEQSRYDDEDEEALITTLALVIADARGVDPLDYSRMPPLYDRIDVATLEDVFFSPSGTNVGSTEEPENVMAFDYQGYRVTIRNDGWISVYEPVETNW